MLNKKLVKKPFFRVSIYKRPLNQYFFFNFIQQKRQIFFKVSFRKQRCNRKKTIFFHTIFLKKFFFHGFFRAFLEGFVNPVLLWEKSKKTKVVFKIGIYFSTKYVFYVRDHSLLNFVDIVVWWNWELNPVKINSTIKTYQE